MTNEQQQSPIFRPDKLKKHLYNTIWGIKQLLMTSRRKVRAVQPHLSPKVTQSARSLGARLVKSLRRVAVRSFADSARPTADPSRCTTPWTAVTMTAMVSPSRQQQVSPLSPRSSTRNLGAIRACMAFMQSMFEAYVKSQKKAGKSKKRKKRDYNSSDSSDSE